MKKKRKIGLGFKILSVILTIMTLILSGLIIYLGILNIKLLIVVLASLIGVNLVLVLLLLKSKRKKLGLFMSVIFIIIYSLIGFYIVKTTFFLNNLDSNIKTYNYSVVVLKDSEYSKLKDIKSKTLGYYDEESVMTDKSLGKVTDKIEVDVEPYDNTHDLAIALINKELDAILVEDSYLDVIEIDGGLLSQKVKKIYSFKIHVESDDLSKDLNVLKEPFNIYVSGIDTYGEISSVSRSDVNMVVTVNPKTRQILLTSIPRDYYVTLPEKGAKDKLTHAGMYGTEMSISAIEDLLDIEINYYVKVNFSSVVNIVDTIGGVNVYSDYAFTSMDNFTYKEGNNQLNGEEALSFARERKAFLTGDRQRVKNQQALLKGIFEKCMSKSIILKYTKLLDSLENSFVTNMKMNRMTSLVRMQLANNYSWNIVSNSLNGMDSSNYTYSAPSVKVYVMEPSMESVNFACDLINKVIDGETLNKEEIEGSQVKINNGVVNQSSANDEVKEEEVKKEEVKEEVLQEEKGLVAKLIKSSIEITLGDDYIYNGVNASYNDKDINDDVKVTFKIGNKELDDYYELIRYVKTLESGDYDIVHIVTYKDEEITLIQKLTIKELVQSNEKDEEESDDSEITSPNDGEVQE